MLNYFFGIYKFGRSSQLKRALFCLSLFFILLAFSSCDTDIAPYDLLSLRGDSGTFNIAEDKNISCFVEWPDKISPLAKKSFSGRAYTIKVEFGIGVGMRKVTLLEK